MPANSTHTDRKKTGGLYAVHDVMDNAPSTGDEWFDYYIEVDGKHIVIRSTGKRRPARTNPPTGIRRNPSRAWTDASSVPARSRCRAMTPRALLTTRICSSGRCPERLRRRGASAAAGRT
jgi:hypothetical protein